MSGYIERMQKEWEDLQDKITKGTIFQGTDTFKALDPFDQILLRIQIESMIPYGNILLIRIKRAQGVLK